MNRRFLPAALVALLLLVGASAAQTMLPDTLGGMTLRAVDSPYATGEVQNLIVPPGDTLRVEAGVSIHFATNSRLVVQGCLLTEGRSDSLVLFTMATDTTTMRWLGVRFEQVEGTQQLTSRVRYTRFHHGTSGIIEYYSDRNDIDDPNLIVDRCIFTDLNQGVVFYSPVRIRNTVFEGVLSYDIQNLFTAGSVRNCVFLPHPSRPYRYSVLINEQLNPATLDFEYNCFDAGENNERIRFLVWTYDPNAEEPLHEVELSSTNIVDDPVFYEDDPWNPVPDLSPLVDAGDPDILDPDLTRSDIGVFWVGGELTPLAIVGELDRPAWVVGYDYRGAVQIEGYPPAAWTVLEGPEGFEVQQLNRNELTLLWPVADQLPGLHPLRIAGVNDLDGVLHLDTLETVLDFQVNTAPFLSSFEPCPDGDCAGDTSILFEEVPAGDALDFRLRLDDADAARIGVQQTYKIRRWKDGVLADSAKADSLVWTLQLDTTAVDYRLVFDDGLAQDTLDVRVEPRFTRLAGAIAGSLGETTGPVYLVGPVWVEEGEELVIEPGARVAAGGLEHGEAVFEIRGRLVAEGEDGAPIAFRSLAPWDDVSVDDRPWWFRLAPGSELDGLRHLRFEGMGVAVSLEYLDRATPLPIEDCEFVSTRTGVLAVGTPVDVRRCVFDNPRDSLQIGSYGLYLAESEGSTVRNCLFRNPIVGVAVVDGQASISHNSFVAELLRRPGTQSYDWPAGVNRGAGRVTVVNGTAALTDNLFHWKTDYSSSTAIATNLLAAEALRDRLLATRQRAVWLDEESVVRMRWNWYDVHDGQVTNPADSVWFDLVRALAVNDSLLLTENVGNGDGPAGFDASADWRLFADSPLVDAGDPASAWNDAFDGSRADIGWTGGPLASERNYSGEPATEIVEPLPLPTSLALAPPWPNPFNPSTRLAVEMARTGRLELSVYNLLGQRVATLADDRLEAGRYEFVFDAGQLASGAYFARARCGDEVSTVKLLLLR